MIESMLTKTFSSCCKKSGMLHRTLREARSDSDGQLLHVYAKNYECNGQMLLIRILRYSLDGMIFISAYLNAVDIFPFIGLMLSQVRFNLCHSLYDQLTLGLVRIPGVHGCAADNCQCSTIGFLIRLHRDRQGDVRVFLSFYRPLL